MEYRRMKLILAFAIFAIVLDCGISEKSPEEKWFTQIVDHFNPADDRVWKQRYIISDEHYKPDGPIFMYPSGECKATLYDKWLHEGQMYDEAKRFGAMMIILETRFYGDSQPFPDLSTENLAYLNSQQILLDAAYFIEGIKKDHKMPKDTKVITFGCSYAGTLSGWVRAKYPHLVQGAVALSGPVITKLDNPEILQTVEESVKSHSQACVDVISEVDKEIDKMLESQSGRQRLEKVLKLCDPLEREEITNKDIANLHKKIIEPIVGAVKNNNRDHNSTEISVDAVCDSLTDETNGDPMNRFSDINSRFLAVGKKECLDYKYDKFIKKLSNVTINSEEQIQERQWMYQSCTELGFFLTSTPKSNLFGDHFPSDFYLQQCVDIFGPKFARLAQPGLDRTRIIFGGEDLPKVMSNVVFVQGSRDTWRPLGITKSSNPEAPVIEVEGSAHCGNIDHLAFDDKVFPNAIAARKQITGLITKWLEN